MGLSGWSDNTKDIDNNDANIVNNQVAEEKANARESSYKEQIKTLTAKLKQESTS